ncbi:hypothetical protein, unlikely [Trypanosoma brucei brucei TREU927]|uniref:Uncharacterized protein n=2 Tax=Trypanosoma brucei TaxID=5691 RepID=Q38EQ7_TRYB2|nr:hypothetical protein, unlikely [Trypanosoma brucei brucei TREU927]EAN76713.1 hypothetical protein, unlikely [Trypanosoma brucei brucei TREU927]RHW70100.1 hypothetical protein DPX39_090033400 [Trypanosoma brucei equiperdum]
MVHEYLVTIPTFILLCHRCLPLCGGSGFTARLNAENKNTAGKTHETVC